MTTPAYTRILLKLSGEALMGDDAFGINRGVVERIVAQVKEVAELGVQVGVVIGGGNIFRGVSAGAAGMDRATADYMGMLATVINALALQDAMNRAGLVARVQSALNIEPVCEPYIRGKAIRYLEEGKVVIFAAGTGNPFFTTDTAAALRGREVEAQIVLKATKVDGVYTADPRTDPKATRYDKITYDEAFVRNLKVMDATALALCRDQRLPINVFSIFKEGALRRVVMGENEGTLVQLIPGGRMAQSMEDIKRQAAEKMAKSLDTLRHSLAKVRTGRAHTGLLDHLRVDYYGTPTPINQVANVTLVDARTIGVQPYEKKMVQAVERTIRDSDLGVNPATSGDMIRVPMPSLTEERRRELTKIVRHEGEEAKVAVRNVRRDANTHLKEMLKKHDVPEDEEKRAQDEVQKLTDKAVTDIDKMIAEKEKELMAV